MRDSSLGNRGRGSAGLEDLPSQLPTELADGLGLESDLETGRPVSFAPPRFHEDFGSPALGSRKEAVFRLQISMHWYAPLIDLSTTPINHLGRLGHLRVN